MTDYSFRSAIEFSGCEHIPIHKSLPHHWQSAAMRQYNIPIIIYMEYIVCNVYPLNHCFEIKNKATDHITTYY